MNGILHESQLPINGILYCDVREKEMNFSSRRRHINSNTRVHKENFGIVVKEYEVFKPKIDEINYASEKVIKNCTKKDTLTFEYRCGYDNNVMRIVNNQKVILTIIIGFKCFKSEFYRLDEQIKNEQKNEFELDEIAKLTIKIVSSLSHGNTIYNLKLPRNEISKIVSRNPN